MGCESIDPAHARCDDGSLVPVPGQVGNAAAPQPTPPPPSPGSCQLCPIGKLTAPGCRGVLQRVAGGEQHTCGEARETGVSWSCPPTPSEGFYPKSQMGEVYLKGKKTTAVFARALWRQNGAPTLSYLHAQQAQRQPPRPCTAPCTGQHDPCHIPSASRPCP